MSAMWLADANLLTYLPVVNFLLLASTNTFPGRQGLSPRNGYCCTVFFSFKHPVPEGAPPFLPGVFRGQIPPRQDPFLLP